MQLTKEKRGECSVLTVHGRLDGTTSAKFETEVLAWLSEGGKSFVIDMAGISFINSGSLRVLLSTARRVSRTGGKIVLAAPNAVVTEVFEIANFPALFTICQTLDEGITAATSGLAANAPTAKPAATAEPAPKAATPTVPEAIPVPPAPSPRAAPATPPPVAPVPAAIPPPPAPAKPTPPPAVPRIPPVPPISPAPKPAAPRVAAPLPTTAPPPPPVAPPVAAAPVAPPPLKPPAIPTTRPPAQPSPAAVTPPTAPPIPAPRPSTLVPPPPRIGPPVSIIRKARPTKLEVLVGTHIIECHDGDIIGLEGTVAPHLFKGAASLQPRHLLIGKAPDAWFIMVPKNVQIETLLDDAVLPPGVRKNLSGEHRLKIAGFAFTLRLAEGHAPAVKESFLHRLKKNLRLG